MIKPAPAQRPAEAPPRARLSPGRERRAWLCNTDVESEWSRAEEDGERQGDERAVLFHRFEEILLPSIPAADLAILRTAPDPELLTYLEGLRTDLPEILVAGSGEGARRKPTSRLVRDDPAIIEAIAARRRSGQYRTLEPFGVSENVEAIAARTGLRLSGSPAATAERVSRKSSARRLARELGFPLPEGEICDQPADLPGAVRRLRRSGDGRPVVVKPDLEASGRGQRLVRTERDLATLAAAVDRGELGGSGTTHVVERWYQARATLTYGFVIHPSGRVHGSLTVRQAIGRSGSPHHGYFYPAPFGDRDEDALRAIAERLAEGLRRDHGYVGPVRCDALLVDDGRLFPVLELNARHSFFTFVDMIHERLAPGGGGLFRWFFFRRPGPLPFRVLTEQLIGHDLLFDPHRREGIVVPTFGTVTAGETLAAPDGRPPLRRLFVLVLASSVDRTRTIADALWKRLRPLLVRP